MRHSNQILFASTNLHKFREFELLFKPFAPLKLTPAETVIRNPGHLAAAEKGSTYLENALAKARLANHASHFPTLADDTGLEVIALGGKPGVKSFRYAKVEGPYPTRAAQDEANRSLLLKELQGKSGGDRAARFVTVLALVMEGISLTAEGVLEGSIADAPRGKEGFGYDSIFVPAGQNKTLAEMSEAEKNAVSHRGKALQRLMEAAKTRGLQFART
jgi:XTP/dITP diphosphohydrolase